MMNFGVRAAAIATAEEIHGRMGHGIEDLWPWRCRCRRTSLKGS
jgi:hypothetical protein